MQGWANYKVSALRLRGFVLAFSACRQGLRASYLSGAAFLAQRLVPLTNEVFQVQLAYRALGERGGADVEVADDGVLRGQAQALLYRGIVGRFASAPDGRVAEGEGGQRDVLGGRRGGA